MSETVKQSFPCFGPHVNWDFVSFTCDRFFGMSRMCKMKTESAVNRALVLRAASLVRREKALGHATDGLGTGLDILAL
jgi:hypothetical protein